MNNLAKCFFIISSFPLFLNYPVYAQTNTSSTNDSKKSETIYRIEVEDELSEEDNYEPNRNSKIKISKQSLQTLQSTDVEQVLQTVPGVVLQTEDGYGLRPNIGLRGVNPHRSKKVCLLEDDVLIAPAPYSAPAAYYFPNMSFTETIEVTKGPSAIIHGPNNLGGSINILTTKFFDKQVSKASLSAGSFGEQKFSLLSGSTNGNFSWLIGLSHLSSDGFKSLPDGSPTGFDRNDAMIKLRQNMISDAGIHSLTLKANYGEESSHETYLGVTPEDFKSDPYERYAASQKDLMEWDHQHLQLDYSFEDSNESLWKISVYQSKFNRAWNKFNGFGSENTKPMDVLYNTNSAGDSFLRILKGEADSSLQNGADLVSLGNNERSYYSRGIQFFHKRSLFADSISPDTLQLGMRFHTDGIKRNHSAQNFQMLAGKLRTSIDEPRQITDKNEDGAEALAAFARYDLNLQEFQISPGVRFESVKTTHKATIDSGVSVENPEKVESREDLVGPGLGFSFLGIDEWILFTGLYKAFSPTGPGQTGDIKPEESINYELGANYNSKSSSATAVVFYNDYKNIKGICTQSSGCSLDQLDQEFNGGKARVYGFELAIDTKQRIYDGYVLGKLNYTYTYAGFAEALNSNSKEWGEGEIKTGDPLPYIPDHKISLQMGYQQRNWDSQIHYIYTGLRFDQAVSEARKELPAYGLWNFSGQYKLYDFIALTFKIENLLDETYISSMRPFGYRPGKPRTFLVGTRFQF